MNKITLHNDTFVVDTQTGSIYEVGRPDRLTYKLDPVVGDQVLRLDEWGYRQHFEWGIFKYVNHG